MRIRLVEDEPELAAMLIAGLRALSYVVDHCRCPAEAVEATMTGEYRAVLLDRHLPDGDGLALLPVLATRSAPPVIVLTAMDDVPERVAGLDAGARDYLVKPFAFDELAARLCAILRPADMTQSTVRDGRLHYNFGTRALTVGDAALYLPRRELAILDALMRRASRVVMRESLEAQVYGFDDEISSNALEAHVSRLRKRLAEADAKVVVHAVRGVGYLLRAA